MNDADIAPLAQRLAEENNVDWRRLNGSGANGRIVERDVLEYLARVMAGEESLDPTPEPLPEGMEAWPEEEGMRVRGDVAARTAPAAAGSNGAAGREGFDRSRFAPDDGRPAEGPVDDDLLLAGDDLAEDEDEGLLLPPEEARPASRDEDLPDLFDDDRPSGGARARGDAPALFDGDVGWDDEAPARSPSAGPDERPYDGGDAEEDATFDFGGFPGADDDGTAPRADERSASGAEDSAAGRPSDDAWTLDDAPSAGAAGSPDLDLGGMDDLTNDWEDLDDRDARGGPSGLAAGAQAAPEPTFEPAAPAMGSAEGVSSDAGSAVAGGTGRAAAAAMGGELPLARSRQVLRRQVDLGQALALQRLLSNEGSAGDDVALTALLLIAARREVASLGLSRPGVAVGGQDGRTVGAPVAGATLGEVAARLADGVNAADGEADLLVADLSGYGLDDAVLDADVPQLTLGRVLSDGDDGAVRATLALAGDVGLESGAGFLARVAALVEEPLRLLI